MSYSCQKCKKIEGHRFRFRDKACGRLPLDSVLVQVLVGTSKRLEQIIQIEHYIVKSPNWS